MYRFVLVFSPLVLLFNCRNELYSYKILIIKQKWTDTGRYSGVRRTRDTNTMIIIMYIYIGRAYTCCYNNYHNNDNHIIIMVRYVGVRPTATTAWPSEAVFVYIFSSVGVVLLGNVKTLLFITSVVRELTGRCDRCPFRQSSVTLRTNPVTRGVQTNGPSGVKRFDRIAVFA